MHLHAHLAKGNLAPGKGRDTPQGLEPHWHLIRGGAGVISVMQSQPQNREWHKASSWWACLDS